jgi:hypothetical protein
VRVLVAALGAAVLIVAPAASARPAPPECSAAAARAAIAEAKPRLALIGDKVLIRPGQANRVLCFDATGDVRDDMAVSLASGGTAGDVGWLLFVSIGALWQLSGSGTGYKLGLFQSGPKLEVVQPVYRAKDPNCCPTGGFDHTLYGWNGSRLVVARTWHTKTFKAPAG